MDRSEIARTMAARLRARHPDARYELDWTSPFQLLVGTILAGGSRDALVNEVTPTLFARWPDARWLATAESAALEAILRPLGLAAQKAERLHAVAQALLDHFGGDVPKTMDEMLMLPGVQRKSANVVLTNAFGVPSGIVVDRHVARVAQRVGLSEREDPEAIELDLMKLVPVEDWIHFGAATILHGRYHCTAKQPRCGDCFLADICPKRGVTDPAPGPGAAPAPPLVPVAAMPAQGEPKAATLEAPRPPTAAFAWPDDLRIPEKLLKKTKKKAAVAAEVPAPTPAPFAVSDLDASAVPADWASALGDRFPRADLDAILAAVAAERAAHTVYPPASDTFAALHLTPFAATRVVILGQDPYHGPGQAHGLAFSVRPGVKIPPSLANMYTELQADVGCPIPTTGSLIAWAKQGVLLLNAVLTVRSGEPGSHAGLGWARFTDAVIGAIAAQDRHVVFALWGNYAKKKARLVDGARHTLVEGAHPSPLSAKLWFGSRPFSRIDAALRAHDQPAIDWRIE